ncbi:MAG TPA: beta-ketoacyl synthase N-terminal-like domain-containing protein [Candidatus Polarisedimenticolaceae bacterium]|nr:beta-ketoacyl synthase N-terminal-like domain-containing protein [Candidatus Polarisedimenticolaceae bacterium]
MSPRVVVTGLGAVGPHGVGREALAAAFARGEPLASAVDRSEGFHDGAGSRLAAAVGAADLGAWLPPSQARRLGKPSRWAVAASRMALAEAGLADLQGKRAAVFLATAFGAVHYTEKLVRQLLDEGPEAAQPFYFSECVANAAAGQVAIALGASGANVTVTQREAGPLIALARGAQEVGEGRADVAIVGSADEMTPLLHAILDRYRATTRAEGESPRPFDRDRDGMLAGEGATMLVLEREADATARGASPLARIAGSASAFDPTATPSDWGDGADGLGRRLRVMRETLGPIDAIVSGASGTRRGDRLEALVLRSGWDGGALPPVLVPKAVVGEYAGGVLSGGLLALAGASFGPVAGFRSPDPELLVMPHDGSRFPRPARILASSLAAGGAAAWAVLERA